MSVFDVKDFDDHEQVVFCRDPTSGLRAIIAIHNTSRGPSLGGCRMWPYPSDEEALKDVLRLSKGMTYKSAMANLDLGGGKSVIFGNPRTDKSECLLRAMGRFVDSLGGRYIAAEDSGTCVGDLKVMAKETRYVAGITEKTTGDGSMRSGDPSPATAYGVFSGIRAAVRHRFDRDDLEGLRVAVQGMGNVGFRLARHLTEAGARLWVCDIYEDQVRKAVEELGAKRVAAADVFDLDVDVFTPCALGAVINDETLPRLKATIVAGAANNQLAEPRHGRSLMDRGILYAPDYVINAGGIIDVSFERVGFDRNKLLHHLDGIGETLTEIFVRAEAEQLPTDVIADRIAEERFQAVH